MLTAMTFRKKFLEILQHTKFWKRFNLPKRYKGASNVFSHRH